MNRRTLKDSHFHIIGYIETKSDGTEVAKDSQFQILGYYDPRTNKTKDAQFRIIGEGNFLASFITSSH